MAGLRKASLGSFPDLAETVAKLSESVKNIDKNLDSALGLEEKADSSSEASGIWPSASDRKALFDSFMGNKGDDNATEVLGDEESPEHPSPAEEHITISTEETPVSMMEKAAALEENEDSESKHNDGGDSPINSSGHVESEKDNAESKSNLSHEESVLSTTGNTQAADSAISSHQKESEPEVTDESEPQRLEITNSGYVEEVESTIPDVPEEKHDVNDSQGSHDKQEIEGEQLDQDLPVHADMQVSSERESSVAIPAAVVKTDSISEVSDENLSSSSIPGQDQVKTSDFAPHDSDESRDPLVVESQTKDTEKSYNEQHFSNAVNSLDSANHVTEVEKVRKEMKFMEAALQGASRQSQRKSTEAEIDALRDEYHQRVSALERKVYALTKERDTLRREQNGKSDAAALLKEKDEIISQVMAEGEELLSKKQAATIRKLRAQIREFEEEKQRLSSKLQAAGTKVESIKKDKAATEKLLQETMERNQEELAAQKEFNTNALNAAKVAEALAESRANNEARVELQSRLREADERQTMLVETLEELRQTLSRREILERSGISRFQWDVQDMRRRFRARELWYDNMITQVPESTRSLLRQIEAMQVLSAGRQEAWAGVERTLNSRLQEAEAKAAGAEERELAMNERLSQASSRITVLETQNTCLRTEQKQLSRSLQKERQRAAENRQEYLAAVEEAATQEGRAKQLEDEIRELRSKIKHQLLEEVARKL